MMPRRLLVDQVVREETTVAELVSWTYRRQKADLITAKPLHLPAAETGTGAPRSSSRDGCVALARAAALGGIIPTTAQFQRPTLHPDAEAVHDLVVELSRTDPLGAMLLLRHGKSGEPPEIDAEPPRPEPVTRLRNGREEIVEDAHLPGQSHLERRRDGGGRHGAAVWVEVPHPYCPIRYWPTLEAAEEARLEYRVWRRALTRIAAELPQLKRWIVGGIGAAETP